MIFAANDFFNISDFCFAVKICVHDVICCAFKSISWPTSLKNNFWTHLVDFNFFLIYQLRIISVHLSSAKRICPPRLLESWVRDFEY